MLPKPSKAFLSQLPKNFRSFSEPVSAKPDCRRAAEAPKKGSNKVSERNFRFKTQKHFLYKGRIIFKKSQRLQLLFIIRQPVKNKFQNLNNVYSCSFALSITKTLYQIETKTKNRENGNKRF